MLKLVQGDGLYCDIILLDKITVLVVGLAVLLRLKVLLGALIVKNRLGGRDLGRINKIGIRLHQALILEVLHVYFDPLCFIKIVLGYRDMLLGFKVLKLDRYRL